MAQSRFSRRLGFLVILAALSFSMVLPAFALFDQDDTARGDQSLPIAENFSLTTYRDVAVSGTFSAVDPEGDPLTFRVTKNPARGAITFAEEGSARFTYTPYENKTGKDSFTYVAEDGEGNVSQPAVVSIKIQKPDTKVTYSDMAGNPAHKAAIALAERDIFVGEQMGETWFFRPEAPVTREEFLAMAMDVAGLDALEGVTRTGFADDEAIATWAKPYVSSALKAGLIQGGLAADGQVVFEPDSTITRAEAAVLLDRALQISDTAALAPYDSDSSAPVWAVQSAANLAASGVLDAGSALGDTLTRAEAAELLCGALELLDSRDSGGIFPW